VVLLQKRRPDETDNTVPGYSVGFVYVQVVKKLPAPFEAGTFFMAYFSEKS
jgi:hypothetical protein